MRILVVGGGAREHAIAQAVRRGGGELCSAMRVRNPGIARISQEVKLLDERDIPSVLGWAQSVGVEMLVVGPEASLEVGICDAFERAGITVASPSKAAARIETDKSFMRELMDKHDVPGRVEHHSFTSSREAEGFIRAYPGQLVVKPVGLTGGKGVRIEGEHLMTKDEVVAFARECIEKGLSGHNMVVLEERVVGEEFTLQCFTDSIVVRPMPPVQDHKRAYEGDRGPNTGGMGSYSGADHLLPFLPRPVLDQAVTIVQAIVDALRRDGRPYVGAMYGQFMYTARGPVVIEFNARFGDPEAMNVLPILGTNYVDVLTAMVSHTLEDVDVRFEPRATVCKYIVPKGYGTKSLAGAPLVVDEAAINRAGAELFFASVEEREGRLYTMTSRSLAVVGSGATIAEAEGKAETALGCVHGEFDARHDIGRPPLIERRISHMREVLGARGPG